MKHFSLRAGPRRPDPGFTLIELVVAMAIVALLAALAYPSLAGPVFRMRRVDALVALMQIQQAQAHWRGNHATYATLTQLGLPSATSGGHYTLSIEAPSPTGYTAVAVAAARPPASEAACARLHVELAGAEATYRSGPDAAHVNPPDVNRRCWNQ